MSMQSIMHLTLLFNLCHRCFVVSIFHSPNEIRKLEVASQRKGKDVYENIPMKVIAFSSLTLSQNKGIPVFLIPERT